MRPFFFFSMRNALAAVAIVALIATTWWCYAPGLAGGFVFDDFANLPALGAYGPIRSAHTFLLYLTSGTADPIGRPLSMLSFLIDGTDWPSEALSFKRTNVLIHLVNGLLLALVLVRLGRRQRLTESHVVAAAMIATALWLLHPLFVSTTLYVVQREAMLPVGLTLLGVLVWLAGRDAILRGERLRGWLWLVLAAGGCSFLALLCKANGALLPLLLLVLEATLLRDEPTPSALVSARRWLLIVPTFALVAYLLISLPGFAHEAAEKRPWTLAQRLMTEPRAIFDYLRQLIAPHPLSKGVFHDDFRVSTSLFSPWTTLPAIVGLIGLVVLGFRLREVNRPLAFALLFFLAGHALEASVLPLELYFEHRNYLPALFLFWPLALYLTSRGDARALRVSLAGVCVILLAWMTHHGAEVWSDPRRLAFALADINRESPRAQANASQYEIESGDLAAARTRLAPLATRYPAEVQIAFNLAEADCRAGAMRAETLAQVRTALATSVNGARLGFDWLTDAVRRAKGGNCPGLDLDAVEALLASARANPHFADAPARLQDFDHIAGLIALARGDPAEAVQAFERAMADFPRPATALAEAAILGSAGHPELGLRLLDQLKSAAPRAAAKPTMGALHAWLLDRYGYWEIEAAHLRAVLQADIENRGK